MKLSCSLTLPLALVVCALPASAQITWTGTTGTDAFDETNWDLTGSTVTTVDPNVAVDDDMVVPSTSNILTILDLPGQGTLRLADSRTLTLDNSETMTVFNDGFGGIPGTGVGISILVTNGSHFRTFFIVNEVKLSVDSTSMATFGGGGNPINLSTVDLSSGGVVNFLQEDVAAFTTEHLSKFRIDGVPAVLGVNIVVVSDGLLGCIISAAGVGTKFCDPADPNSTGASTDLSGSMSAPGGTGLNLQAQSGPPGNFGYFLIGSGSSDPGIPLGQGHLCLSTGGGNQIGRYNVTGTFWNSVGQFSPSGTLLNVAGTSSTGVGFDVPTAIPSIGGMISAGQTWNFQLWHREAAGQSNFSNGLTVTF